MAMIRHRMSENLV